MKNIGRDSCLRAAAAALLGLVFSLPAMPRQPGSPEVWSDPGTRLTWAARDNAGNGGYHAPGWGLLSQAGAAAYCKKSALAGFHDWRLPTIEEVEQIYDKSVDGFHVRGGVVRLSGDPGGTAPTCMPA